MSLLAVRPPEPQAVLDDRAADVEPPVHDLVGVVRLVGTRQPRVALQSSGRLDDSIASLSMVNLALPLNWFVPRRVTKLMPMPPVWTFRSLPPVLTATSSNASKSKYDDEAPPDVVSVMTTPSRFHIVSVASAPLPTNPDCWPDSLPPTFTRSTMTPGTVLSIAHGSFDCGVLCSSSAVSVVEVPDLLGVDDRRVGRDRHRLFDRLHRHRERDVRVDAGVDDHFPFHLVEAGEVGRDL